MAWTRDQQLEWLLSRPWTIAVEPAEDGLIARVAELPSVVATGASERLLARDLWAVLRATLTSYLDYNDPISYPLGERPLWELGHEPPGAEEEVHLVLEGDAWDERQRARSSASRSTAFDLAPA